MEVVPTGPHYLTAAINHYVIAADLKNNSIHAICCGSGNKVRDKEAGKASYLYLGQYANAMEKDRTLLLINHGDCTGVVFDKYHFTGLQYTPLVEIQLNDFAGSIGPIEKVRLIYLVMSIYFPKI